MEQTYVMNAETILTQAKHDCLLWVKAFHNINRSESLMRRFAGEKDSQDHEVKEALFQAAVVNYAKPFVRTETSKGRKALGTKDFKHVSGFDIDMHGHILELRNKLIAHDDLTEVEPRFVWVMLEDSSVPDSSFAPFQACLRNRCISYPQNMGDFDKMHTHTRAVCVGVLSILDQKVARVRQSILEHPKEARSVFGSRPDSTLGTIVGDGKLRNSKSTYLRLQATL